jgi:hypothetical protein
VDDRRDTVRPRPSNLYLAVVAVEVAFFLWLGWHRGRLAEFLLFGLIGALALYGAGYAAASSARMARWMRTRGTQEGGDQPRPR